MSVNVSTDWNGHGWSLASEKGDETWSHHAVEVLVGGIGIDGNDALAAAQARPAATRRLGILGCRI
jgi:TPP-dependent pyruvate/acetoin dehydrogenase alpha subunit